MKYLLLSLFCAGTVLACEASELLKNGDFSLGSDWGTPAGWTFNRLGNADVEMKKVGAALRVSKRGERAPNTYGSLTQYFAAEPDVEYLLSCAVKGKGELTIAIGSGWRTRFTVKGDGAIATRRFKFKLNAGQIGGDGKAIFVIIAENPCEQLELSELSLAPAAAADAASGNLLRNGSFEDGLEGWSFSVMGNAKVEMVPDDSAAIDGKASLLIRNASRQAPNVYGRLHQDVGLKPGVPYELSGYIRGKNAERLLVVLGKGWETRLPVPVSGTEWEPFYLTFTLEPGQLENGRTHLSFLSEGLAEEIRLDGLTLGDRKKKIIPPSAFRSDRVWRIPPLPQPLSGLTSIPAGLPVLNDGNDRAAIAYDEQGIIFLFEADGLRVRLGAAGTEFIFPAGPTRFNAARLDWKRLEELGVSRTNGLLFDLRFGRSGSLQPSEKEFADDCFRGLFALPGGSGEVDVLTASSPVALNCDLWLTGYPRGTAIEGVLTDSAGKTQSFPLGKFEPADPRDIFLLGCRFPVDGLAEGEIGVRLLAGGKTVGEFRGVKSNPVKEQSLRLRQLTARYDGLKKELLAHYGATPMDAAFSIPVAVLDDMLPLLAQWLKEAGTDETLLSGMAIRLAMVLPGVEESLDEAEQRFAELKSGRKLPETWKYVTGQTRLNDGWPYAELESSGGKRKFRPVMLDGYGHFQNMTPCLPRFQEYGANVIQMELGPWSIFPKEGKEREFEADFSGFEREILPRIELCRKNNLQFNFLISPHYTPKWWLAKYPHTQYASGFLRFDILRPEARTLMAEYIKALIGRLRQIPAPEEVINSICLQNEPVYFANWENPYTREQFDAFLKKNWPGVEFNLAAGLGENAVRGAWNAFRKQVMTEWSAFLGEEVKKAWPEIPVHTKIMIGHSVFCDHGVDPEAFARMSDYNGNDNYCMYGEGPYVSDWVRTAIGSELQYSMRPLSLSNTENHIIRDNEKRPIPNRHIRTAILFQHLTGSSTLVTWVWNLYKPDAEKRIDFAVRGGIALRPGNLIAHGLAQVDATRLAPEIIRFSQQEPTIALLYSPSTLNIDAAAYEERLRPVFTEAAFTGNRVRFLSERQLAEGDFGGVKLLLAVGAPNISPEAVAGMKKFLEKGGRIAADEHSLKRDPIDRPLVLPFRPEAISGTVKAAELKNKWFDAVAPSPVSLKELRPGVFFRQVPGEKPGTRLVCLVNFNRNPVRLALTGTKSRLELFSNLPYPEEFELVPLEPLLIEAAESGI